MTYTAYIEESGGSLRTFPDVTDVMYLPTGVVHLTTDDDVTLTIPGGEIIRLKRDDK